MLAVSAEAIAGHLARVNPTRMDFVNVGEAYGEVGITCVSAEGVRLFGGEYSWPGNSSGSVDNR